MSFQPALSAQQSADHGVSTAASAASPLAELPITRPQVTIDGVAFEGVGADALTFEQSLRFMAEIEAAGIGPSEIAAFLAIQDEMQRAVAFMASIYASGRVFHLLATVLVRTGTLWSPEQAEENAALFARARGQQNHRVLTGVLVEAVFSCFPSSSASPAASSPTSSTLTVTALDTVPTATQGKTKTTRGSAPGRPRSKR